MKTLWTNRTRRAVTLTELLVVLAIVSLLATLAVPVYVQQTERARKAIARSEVRAIAEAQQMCAALHGFYVPINMLDNVADDPNDTVPPGGGRDDFANHPNLAGMNVIDANASAQSQQGTQLDFADRATDLRIENMIDNWEGPFLNPVRVTERFTPDNNPLDQDEVSYDIVLDPWGRPYQMYSSEGICSQFASPLNLNDFDPSQQTDRIDVDSAFLSTTDDRFDRYAIVSFGNDGRADSSAGSTVPDDLVYMFAANPNPLTAP